MIRILLQFREVELRIECDYSFKAASCGNPILTDLVDRGEQPQYSRFPRTIGQFDEVLRGVVEASLCFYMTMAVEKHFPQLAIAEGKALFIAHDAVGVQRLLEITHCFIPMRLPGLLHPEIVIQNAQRAMVVERHQQIERFEVVGAGSLGMPGSDVEITKIDERLGNDGLVPFLSLEIEHFSIAGFGLFKFPEHGANVSQVTE